jgi:hypothetical protein
VHALDGSVHPDFHPILTVSTERFYGARQRSTNHYAARLQRKQRNEGGVNEYLRRKKENGFFELKPRSCDCAKLSDLLKTTRNWSRQDRPVDGCTP